MSEKIVISLKNVSKCFMRYEHPVDRLKELILPRKTRAKKFWALEDINLELPKGHTIGVVGRNGSGKSTLLQVIVGTLTPTTGEVTTNGRISALLELGSGFNPEFTGRQNVFLNAKILGLTQEQIEQKFDEIAAFADIDDFIDQPVKTYSSGMYVRLAFSVAINVDPDILVVDEALSVGDARFQQRCMSRINHLRDTGVSILFVSHDSEAVKRLCDHVLVIDKGKITNSGSALHMTNWYLALMTVDFDLNKLRQMENSAQERDKDNLNSLDSNSSNNGEDTNLSKSEFDSNLINNSNHDLTQSPEFKYFRHGDGKARITKIIVKNSQNQEVDIVYIGEMISIYIEVEFLSEQSQHLIGILLRDRLGTDIIGINTYQEKIQIPKVNSGDILTYCFSFDMNIKPGEYSISPSVAYDQYIMQWLDWIENALIIRVVDPDKDRLVFGSYLPPKREIRVEKRTRTIILN